MNLYFLFFLLFFNLFGKVAQAYGHSALHLLGLCEDLLVGACALGSALLWKLLRVIGWELLLLVVVIVDILG